MRTEPHWLIKDFNVVYRAAARLLETLPAQFAGEQRGEAAADLRSQLERLKPALEYTESVRAAARVLQGDPGDPLDDQEVRDLTLWETDSELPAFRAGWLYYRNRYELPPDYFDPTDPTPGHTSKQGNWGQNERVAFARGALACKVVRDVLGPAQLPTLGVGVPWPPDTACLISDETTRAEHRLSAFRSRQLRETGSPDEARRAELVWARRLLERCEAFLPKQVSALIADVRAFIGVDARGFRTAQTENVQHDLCAAALQPDKKGVEGA